MVRLYVQDRGQGEKKLVITAQVSLVLSFRDRSDQVPVFVQLDSDQPCLLGINVISLLGINILQDGGKLVAHQTSSCPAESEVTTVCLAQRLECDLALSDICKLWP